MIASVVDAGGRAAGVIRIRMTRRWLLDLASGLKERLRDEIGTQALVLDDDDAVLAGPPDLVRKRLEATSVSADAPPPVVGINAPMASVVGPSRVERLADGSQFLVAHVIPEASDPLHALGWSVVVRQPLPDATRGARILRRQITAVLLGLGLLAALLGVLLVCRLTKSLDTIAHSADAIRLGHAEEIVVPPGRNEATRLGQALHELLHSLQRERKAWQALNSELDHRVATRTREIGGSPGRIAPPPSCANASRSRATCTTRSRIR